MMKFNLKTILMLAVIIIAASLFRITNLDLIEFKADEAINIFLASRILFNHTIPPGSTASSVGILNPPLMNYMLLPIIFLSTDPRIITLYIAILNILSIAALFLIIKNYFGHLHAFISTILFSLSPWMIIYSRKIWAQDFIIPLSIPLFLCIFKIVIDKKMFYWIWVIFFSLLLLQIHQSLIFFLLPIYIFLFIQKTAYKIKYIFLGFILGLAPLLQYIYYEVVNKCPDCATLLSLNEKLYIDRTFSIFSRPFQIMSQGNFYHIMGNDMSTFANVYPVAYFTRQIFYIEYLILPIGIFFFWKKFRNLRFLIYSCLSLPLLYYIFRVQPFTHYFIILSPLLFLFLSYPIVISMKSTIKIIKYLAYLILILLISTSLIFNYSFVSLLKEKGSLSGDYGITYSASRLNFPIEKYQNDIHLQEMLIESRVPYNVMYGYRPVGKMLYDFSSTEKNLEQLEKRLDKVPEDARVQHELLAYYTQSIPTKSTLDILMLKTKKIYGYQGIYKEVFNAFLVENHKKYFSNDIFSLEYPEHWNLKDDGDITIVGDDVQIVIIKNPAQSDILSHQKTAITIPLFEKKVQRYRCSEDCLFILEPFKIGNDFYLFKYESIPQKNLDSNINPKTIGVLDEIVSSIRTIIFRAE